MKFGVCLPNYGKTASPEALVEVAKESERLGYDSVWATDHVLMQRNSNTPYERIFESITTLAYVCSVTRKIKLGISSLIIALRNPIVVAKQLATIDNFSHGRLLLAVGAGWNEAEFNFLGSDFHKRGKVLDESILLLRSLWSGKESFKGNLLKQSYNNCVFEPLPISKLEIWIAGSSKAAMRRAATLGDAWHPNAYPLDLFENMVRDFRKIKNSSEKKICVRIGVNMKSEKTEYNVRGERRLALCSRNEENEKIISRLEELGVSYLVLSPNPAGDSSTEEQVNAIEKLSSMIDKFG